MHKIREYSKMNLNKPSPNCNFNQCYACLTTSAPLTTGLFWTKSQTPLHFIYHYQYFKLKAHYIFNKKDTEYKEMYNNKKCKKESTG